MAYDYAMSEKSQYEGRDLEAMSSAPQYHAWILRELAPYLGKKIAEIGAGSGTFSSLLAELQGNELLAVEPSQEMYPLLVERLSAHAHARCTQAFFADISEQYRGYFDSIVYINVLEHIKDDEDELRHAYKALKNGGTLCVFVPALGWLFGEHDRSVGHQRRYDKLPMHDLLEKTGFEVVMIRYFDIVGVLPWLISMRLMNRRLSSGNAAFYDTAIVPLMSKLEAFVHPPIGKNLIAIAKKKS